MYSLYLSPNKFLRARRIFIMGNLLVAGSSVLFEYIIFLTDNKNYVNITLYIGTRIFQAFGTAEILTSSLAIATHEFRDKVAFAFAFLLTFCSGGVLLARKLPIGNRNIHVFGISGISYCICILALFILPQYRTSPREIRSLSRGTTAFMTKRSIFSLNSFSITLASCGLVFVQENMEFHFLKLGEFMSLISTINQILTTSALLIISGWLLRGKYDFFQFKKFKIAFCVLIVVSLVIIVLSLFFFSEAKWIYGIGHALLGIGAATNLVVLFVDEIQQALNKGCPHSMLTYGLICGVWLSDFMFGYFYGVFIADRNFLKDVEKSIAFLALIFLYIILVISLSVKMSNYYKTTIPSKIKTKKKDRSFSLDLSENMRLLNHEV